MQCISVPFDVERLRLVAISVVLIYDYCELVVVQAFDDSCWHGSVLVLSLDREVWSSSAFLLIYSNHLFQIKFIWVPSPLSLADLMLIWRMQKQHWRVSTALYIFVRIFSVHTFCIVIDFKVELGSVFWNIVQYVNDGFLLCEALLTEIYIATYSASTICKWEVDSCCHNIDCSSLKWRLRHDPSQWVWFPM